LEAVNTSLSEVNMPSELKWLVESRVIHLRLIGVVTVDEGRQNNEKAVQMIDSGKPPVHTILVDKEVVKIDASLSDMVKTMEVYRHPWLKWIVAVGDSTPSTKFLTSILSKLFRVSFHRVATLQEAIDFLKNQDPTIDWTQADESILSEQSVKS
jgi:hypothetical protein